MKVLVSDILAKIPELPPNVRDLVTISSDDLSLANVKSRTSDTLYLVHIKPHADDTGDKSVLDVTCPCDARKLCWHVVAFYAVTKGLVAEKPREPVEPPDDTEPVPATTERNTRTLSRLGMEAVQASMREHEARAAWFAEVERVIKGGSE